MDGRSIKNILAKQKQKSRHEAVIVRNVPQQEKEPAPVETTVGTAAEPARVKEKKTTAKEKEALSVPSQRGLRQIAQDVWKKYGQSAGAREIDGWKLPPIEILDNIAEKEIGQSDNTLRARKIEESPQELRSHR